jgi:branched-chain amino acid transport system substrate-binding protein
MARILLVLVLFATLLDSLACKNRQGETRIPDHTTIKVGYYGDLSGPTFNFGTSARNGVLMAADEINQAGGIKGRRFDIVIEDDQGKPEMAATVVKKLISRDKVVALIGEVTSGSSLAAAPTAQSSRVPMISPSSTNPGVTQVGDYIFRACFIDAFQGEVMAKFAANSLKARKAAIIFDFNSPYSRGLTDYFELSFLKLGGQIVSKQSYAALDRDYKGQLSTIRSTNPDVIYIPGYYGDITVIARQARELGLMQPLLGADGWDAPELWGLGGDALNGSYISDHYSIDDPSPLIQRFVKEYKARYGNLPPDAHAALAYDAMRVLIDAIQRAETTDGPQLRDALAWTKDFDGVTGVISINAERNAVKPAVVLKLQDGQYIYQQTIQPDTATLKSASGASPSPSTRSRKK